MYVSVSSPSPSILSLFPPVCRHTRVMPIYGKHPFIEEGTYVAPNASVIGDVDVGEKSVVWYGAVLRGDVNSIKVGDFSSIGDRVVVHVAKNNPKGPLPTVVGNHVVVEQGAILHACTLEDECFVGMGSILYDGSVLSKHSMLEPGSVLTSGKVVPTRQVWGGSPAKFIRDITDEEANNIKATAEFYSTLGQRHYAEVSKTEADREKERIREELAPANPYPEEQLETIPSTTKISQKNQ
eukprot:Phypoly_transcript_06188.p1 GENE.Phypoly_transcript_06188~~Phypoly_transcript_06188.p1  ORF type:complete len:239 (-),score=52.01 Phypoly_transcript_06188:268-984(-)